MRPEVEVSYRLSDTSFPPLSGRRSGEVIMVVRRHSGGFMLMRKRSYPRAAFRLPTGGIKDGETPHQAFFREVQEEMSLDVELLRYLGVLSYRSRNRRTLLYTSHAFLGAEQSGAFGTADEQEGIDGWEEIDNEGLLASAATLETLGSVPPGEMSWSAWGRFRALGHRFVSLALASPIAPDSALPNWRPDELSGDLDFAAPVLVRPPRRR